MGRSALLGIDLGGSKVLAALFDEKFRLVESTLEHTLPEKGLARFNAKLTRSVSRLAARAKREGLELRAVGAGCAGFVDARSGVLLSCPNIPFIQNYAIAQRLRALTACPVSIGNDAQLGLYGEFKRGAAVSCRSVIGLFLGTGIGGGVVIDGKLHQGASGLAGEVGHYLLDAMGPLSGSDRHGLFDDIASRHAIAAQAASMAAKQWAPHLFREAGANILDIRADVLARAIRRGDLKIEELVRSRARIVGIVLANLVNFLSPDMVVLGGGLIKSLGEIIVPEAEATMRRHALAPISRSVRVVPARLGDLAVATGAAQWALDALAASASPAAEANVTKPRWTARRGLPTIQSGGLVMKRNDIVWAVAALACALVTAPALADDAGQTSQPAGQMSSTTTGQAGQNRAQSVISRWPAKQKAAAQALIQKYGQPNVANDHMLAWNDKGQWQRVAVYSESIKNALGLAHQNFIEDTVAYSVPAGKTSELKKFDHSLVINRKQGTLAARGDSEKTNTLTLNLANEIVTGKRDVASAQQFRRRTRTEFLAGKSSPYMDKLMFQPAATSSSSHIKKNKSSYPGAH